MLFHRRLKDRHAAEIIIPPLVAGAGKHAVCGPESLLAYLTHVNPKGRAHIVSRVGWYTDHGVTAFVLPDAVYGDTGGSQIIYTGNVASSPYRMKGLLEGLAGPSWPAMTLTKYAFIGAAVIALSGTVFAAEPIDDFALSARSIIWLIRLCYTTVTIGLVIGNLRNVNTW